MKVASFLLLCVLTSFSVLAQKALPQTEIQLPAGAVEISSFSMTSPAAAISGDERYISLRRVAEERYLQPDPDKAKEVQYPKGVRAVFVPLLDKQGNESGFIVSSGENWTLSLLLNLQNSRVFEGYSAKRGDNGKVVIEVMFSPKSAEEQKRGKGRELIALATASCQYVSSYSISYSCWSDGNPFGYYYNFVYRYGNTYDPMRPQWWSCYQGYIHVCPQYEDAGSPITFPICGYPPSHPQG